mmetsp:Transcript_66782/g.159778  ORF Transcript_66782/g.159778 Transcript_66782/m.159778 type:complete len:104 (+) Transcript_66782:588-899(+)
MYHDDWEGPGPRPWTSTTTPTAFEPVRARVDDTDSVDDQVHALPAEKRLRLLHLLYDLPGRLPARVWRGGGGVRTELWPLLPQGVLEAMGTHARSSAAVPPSV